MLISENLGAKVYGEYDLIIVGAGPVSCAATISAARNGMKTLIIDRFNCLGGTKCAWDSVKMPLTRIFRCRKSLMQQAFPIFWRDAEKPRKISKKSRFTCANVTKDTLKTYRFKRAFCWNWRKGWDSNPCAIARKLISRNCKSVSVYPSVSLISAYFRQLVTTVLPFPGKMHGFCKAGGTGGH